MTNTNNDPATSSEVTTMFIVGNPDELHCPACGTTSADHLHTDYGDDKDWRCPDIMAIIETRRSGQRSRYPNEQMKRLLHSGAKVPMWRRVMRWVKGVRP